MRMTKQRRAILDVLQNTRSHPSADWVFGQIRKKLPRVSLATVYRNLHQLAEAGLIQELSVGGGRSRFDWETSLHYHVRCVDCGRIDDLDLPSWDGLEKAARQQTGFDLITHHVEFLGHCPDCVKGAKSSR